MSAEMSLPPYARRLDIRATRAAFAAGTLGAVGDDTADVHAELPIEARNADRGNPDNVQHAASVELERRRALVARRLPERELERLERLERWQARR